VPDFYGVLDASALAGVSWPVARGRVVVDVSARLVDWTYAQNASVIATEPALGPIGVGAAVPMSAGRWALSPSVRVLLPFTDSSYGSTAYGAVAAGLAAGVHPRRWLSVTLGAALLGWTSGLATFAAASVSADAGLAPSRWFAFLVGTEAQAGWYGGFDHLLARGGFRLTTRHAGRFDLDALAPLAGDERTTAVFTLAWSLPL
jgi:hypothetical protein